MYDLILLSTLTLPLLALILAGRHFERGALKASLEELAQRRYRLSWMMSLAIIGQVVLMSVAFSLWVDRMETPEWLLSQIGSVAEVMIDAIDRPLTGAILSVTAMLVMVLYYSLYSLPWLRFDRIAKRAQGGAVRRTQVRMTLRSTLAGLIPMALWFSLVNALPQGFMNDPTHLVLTLAGFILLSHSLSPWQVQLANPTAPLPADHPVTRMAMALGRDAGVRIEAVRVIKLGEMKIANAMVSGLWPWLRRIYVTDHMLATFSVAEIRAILAHEVGHLRHRHLWWYLGFALGGTLIIPRMIDALDHLEFLRHSVWGLLIAMGLYWGLMFKFLSRRFEREADRFAVAATGDIVLFQQALEKLADVNGTVKQYSKWDIFQTHPPIAERVKAVG